MKYSKLLCHRIPERSFFYPINYTINLLIISIILMIPAAIDGLTQLMELRQSNNNLRFLTGLVGGIGLIIFMKIAVRTFYYIIGAYL